jgi:hypothetical protein
VGHHHSLLPLSWNDFFFALILTRNLSNRQDALLALHGLID